MLKIKILSIVFFFISTSFFAQESINDYKYIIVPSQFEFQNSQDQDQLNSLTKFLFNKYGFIAFLSTDFYPEDFGKNKCLALTANLRKNKTMFSTKMNFDLVNCYNQVVFSSKEGVSKEKNFKTAYHQALRESFNDIKSLNYKYSPVENLAIKTDDNKSEINEAIIVKEIKEIVQVDEDVDQVSNLLYAQETMNGYQLVDSTPKRIYIIQKTNVKDVYILKDMNGILYKSNGIWIAEYYLENKLNRKELNIKF